MMDFLSSLPMTALAALIVAVGGGVVAFLASRRVRSSLSAAQPFAEPKWTAVEVVFGFFLLIAAPGAALAFLESVGFFSLLTMPADDETAKLMRHLWAYLIGAPVGILAVLMVTAQLDNATSADLGLHLRDAPTQIVRGYFAWLILTPIVFAVFIAANVIFWYGAGLEPQEHGLTTLARHADALTWGLMGLQAVVIAPFVEEFLFRGLLLPFAAARSERSAACIVAAAALAWASGVGIEPPGLRWAPMLFVAVFIPVVFLLSNRPKWAAIVSSSVLFATFHANVWPTPIPLLVLGMGLAWLALRTGSLIGPILAHGLFNAVSLLNLMMGSR